MPNISIVWDFDYTLTPEDSTTKVIEFLSPEKKAEEFWGFVHKMKGETPSAERNWEHVLAQDAPIWMYSLSRVAFNKGIPLNSEFFKKFIIPKISLFPNVENFLLSIKSLEKDKEFRDLGVEVNHFVVSAGLKDLVQEVFSDGLIKYVFGCRYRQIIAQEGSIPENVPVYCIDETAKTRSLFEISKGSFLDEDRPVNKRLEKKELFCPFENMIYIGDGDTDIPSLSLTRDKGGLGVVVYDKEKDAGDLSKKLKNMRLDKRSDLITAADFSLEGELYNYIKNRCLQIMYRYRAEKN